MKLATLPVKKEQVEFYGVLRLLLHSIWTYCKLPFLGLLLTGVFAGLFQLAAPKIFQQIIDQLTKGTTDLTVFVKLALLAALFMLLGALFQYISEKISFYIATQVEDYWRYTSLLKFYQLPMIWQDQHDSGEVGAKMDRGASAIYSILFEIFGQNLLVSFITLIFVLGYALWKFPGFSLIFLLPIPIYMAVTYVISRRIVKMQAHLNRLDHTATRTYFDGVANMRYVKTFGREMAETENYVRKWDRYHIFEYRTQRAWLWQSFWQKFIETAMRAVLLIAAVIAVRQGTLTLGEVVLLVSFQQLTFAPLDQLNKVFTRLRRVTRRASHLFEVIAEEDSLADQPEAEELPTLKKEIQLENIHFEYSKKLKTLHDLSFSIKAGTTTAIVGRSGAGKSTIAMLLMRFYAPDRGRITWDGLDLRQVTRASLRKKVTLILQDTTLFNRSIAANIAYGKPNIEQQEVEAAAKLAHAHNFITKLPAGYESIVGERGVRLSGGQRQRIAIARALLIKPELLIMDEATSHLDSETEVAIKEAIQYLRGKNTQVIIAHRLSTVQHADNIILLDKGRIVAQGKHQQLLRHPLYRKLCRLQLHK